MGQTKATDDDSSRPTGDPGGTPAGTAGTDWTQLCLRSLVDSYDGGRHLFSHQLYEGTWREVDSIYPHETLTSSCIALLGLARSNASFTDHGIDADACVRAIAVELQRTGYRGGLGLAVWANAVVDGPLSAAELVAAAGSTLEEVSTDLVPSLTTMETAWLASGLLHESARRPDPVVRRAAVAVVDELRANRYSGATRLMGHAGPGASALHRARGHIANFADQIYSVQAFAFAADVLGDGAARGAGIALADRHRELQGELGQWWWHYDARRGHVALRYAVYSVHQHGMAPMALSALATATGRDYADAIASSRRWIDHNELGRSMVDEDRSTIWRSIERVEPSAASRVRGVLEALGRPDTRPADVVLNRETRPYEWAWCLYADAIERHLPKGNSLA